MAVKRGAQNNRPWIITIVVLSILIIALGVTTYLGYSGQADIGKARDEAKKSEATRKSERDWFKFEALQLKSYVDHTSLLPNEADQLNADRTRFDSDAQFKKDRDDLAGVEKLIQKYDKETGWDAVKKSPKASLQARIDSLTTELNGAKGVKQELDKAQKAFEKKFADASAAMDKFRKDEGEWAKSLQQANDATKKEKNEKLEKVARDLGETFNTLREESEAKDKKALLEKADLQNQISKLTNEKKTQESKIAVLNEKIAPPYLPDYEQPKGKVDSLDREGRFAYINLGSADLVKPMLTFSIYASTATGRTDLYGGGLEATKAQRERKRAAHEPEPKGSLEVVSILGAHSSKARITDVRDPSRDPIVPGDLLFNPVWSPGERMHVAVTGLIDLSGKGEDNTAEFIHNLERQDVVIDSYLDMKDLTVKGKGITTATNYLVVGQRPEIDVNLALSGSPLADRSNKIEDLMNGMKKQAKDQGVTLIPARNFMALVGYRLPKQITRFSGMHGYSAVGGPAEDEEGKEKKEAPKEKPKPKAKPAPKDQEEKAKDKEEKEDKPKDKEDKEKAKEKEKE